MIVYWTSYCGVKVLDALYCRTNYVGRENLPTGQPFILASNHISNIDPFLLGACQWRRFNYLAKMELFDTPAKNWFFRQVCAIPIKRGTSDFRALREALRRMKAGTPLILFPEGTRGYSERPKEPQPGVGFLTRKSGLPVVPARIEGSDKALPPGAKWFKSHQVKVVFGRPIAFRPEEDYPAVAQRILEAIYALKV